MYSIFNKKKIARIQNKIQGGGGFLEIFQFAGGGGGGPGHISVILLCTFNCPDPPPHPQIRACTRVLYRDISCIMMIICGIHVYDGQKRENVAFDQYNCLPIHLFISFNTIHTANMPVHRALLTSTKCTMRSEKQYMHLSLLDPPPPKKKPPKNQKAKTTINAYVKILQLI